VGVAGKTILVHENGARIDLSGLTDLGAMRVRVRAGRDSGLCLPPAIVVTRPPLS
jgi:thiol:disulfide interchange protein DsbD